VLKELHVSFNFSITPKTPPYVIVIPHRLSHHMQNLWGSNL